MDACPRCGAVGALDTMVSGARGCTRCGWMSDGAITSRSDAIPTPKALLPIIVPIALMLIAAALSPGKQMETPGSLGAAGCAFFTIGLWSGWCGLVWDRLSPGFHRAWRPPYQGTAFLLGVVFTIAGAGMMLVALSRLADAP